MYFVSKIRLVPDKLTHGIIKNHREYKAELQNIGHIE
jgi:hypothetical protein